MAARLTPQQREQIVAHSRAHPGMTQQAVADWAKRTFALPTAPSQSFVSTLLRRSRDGSALPAQATLAQATAAQAASARAKTLAASAAARTYAARLAAAQRGYYPMLSDEMLRWALTCDQPAGSTAAAASDQRLMQAGGGDAVKQERLPLASISGTGVTRAPRPDDSVGTRERGREYQYKRWMELREIRREIEGSNAGEMEAESEFDSECNYDEVAYRYESESDGSGIAEREWHRRHNNPRYQRWLELREIRRDRCGSNAGEMEAESEFDSQYDYDANADRYYGYETETNEDEDESGTKDDEPGTDEDDELGRYVETPPDEVYRRYTYAEETPPEEDYELDSYDEETGDEDAELDSYDEETGDEDGGLDSCDEDDVPDPALDPANDHLMFELAGVLKRGRDAITMEATKEPIAGATDAAFNVKLLQDASWSRLQPPPPPQLQAPSTVAAGTVGVKLESISESQQLQPQQHTQLQASSPTVASTSCVKLVNNSLSPQRKASNAAVVASTSSVKLEIDDPNVSNLAQALKSASEQAARNRDALLRLENLRCETSLKRIRVAEESLRARKRLRDAGVPQSEIDTKLPSPVSVAPLRKLLPKPCC